MSAGTIRDRVHAVVARSLGCHVDLIKGSTAFETMQADWLDVIELVIALEDHFAVTIADDEGDAIVTVDDAVHLIERKLAEAPRA